MTAATKVSPSVGTAELDACVVPMVHPDKVALAREAGPTTDETVRLAALFKLLGDPTRTRILYSLLEVGELCVCDIAATVGVPETSVSQALRLLRTAGVVSGRRSGRMVFYRLADGHVRMLLDLSREHANHDTPQHDTPQHDNSQQDTPQHAHHENAH